MTENFDERLTLDWHPASGAIVGVDMQPPCSHAGHWYSSNRAELWKTTTLASSGRTVESTVPDPEKESSPSSSILSLSALHQWKWDPVSGTVPYIPCVEQCDSYSSQMIQYYAPGACEKDIHSITALHLQVCRVRVPAENPCVDRLLSPVS